MTSLFRLDGQVALDMREGLGLGAGIVWRLHAVGARIAVFERHAARDS
jgi:hypothetical protein